jgi:PAS domain S-box-containing protein
MNNRYLPAHAEPERRRGLDALRQRFRGFIDLVFGKRATRVELDDERVVSTLLRVTLASIGDAVIVTDREARVRSLNAEAERLTGWNETQARGRQLSEVLHIVNEFSGEVVESPVEEVLRSERAAALVNHTILITRTGARIPIDDSAAPIRENDGPVQGAVMVFRDVTEERATQQSLAQLAAVVQYSGDAIVTKNLDGIVQTWNTSA